MTPRNPVHLVALLVLALAAPGRAGATIYKCAVEGATVYYQDAPCAPGRELRDFDRDPANVSVVPFGGPPPVAEARPRGSRGTEKSAAAKSAPRAVKADARARQPLGDARQRRFLRAGMSEGEVLARVGPPDVKARARSSVRWTYMPVIDDDHTMTTLTLERGAVADIERRIIR